MAVCIQDLPSIVVKEILGYLNWKEKLSVHRAIPSWKRYLQTMASWPYVGYSGEASENIYFVKEKRTTFLICLKKYGSYMKHINISFGYPIGRSGLQILNAIADNCINLQRFNITPNDNPHSQWQVDFMWKKSCVNALCRILEDCRKLFDVRLQSLVLDLSDDPDSNIVLAVWKRNLSYKVTCLEMKTRLLEEGGYLHLLTDFTKLRQLIVKREQINKDILWSLVNKSLQEVTICQREELPLSEAQQFNDKFWIEVLQVNPNFKVVLVLSFIVVIKESFPSHMPLRSLVLDDLVNIVTKGIMDHLVDSYKNTLESFTYTNSLLDGFETGDSRLPAALVHMVRECPRLHSVHYGFPLSSTSVLLLASTRKLKRLSVLAVEMSYEFDWPIQEGWDSEFVQWLKTGSQSEAQLEKQVSEIMGYEWKLQYERGSTDADVGLI